MFARFYQTQKDSPFIYGVTNENADKHQHTFVITNHGIVRRPIDHIITKYDRTIRYPIFCNDYLAEISIKNHQRFISLKQINRIRGKHMLLELIGEYDGQKWNRDIPFEIKYVAEKLSFRV